MISSSGSTTPTLCTAGTCPPDRGWPSWPLPTAPLPTPSAIASAGHSGAYAAFIPTSSHSSATHFGRQTTLPSRLLFIFMSSNDLTVGGHGGRLARPLHQQS